METGFLRTYFDSSSCWATESWWRYMHIEKSSSITTLSRYVQLFLLISLFTTKIHSFLSWNCLIINNFRKHQLLVNAWVGLNNSPAFLSISTIFNCYYQHEITRNHWLLTQCIFWPHPKKWLPWPVLFINVHNWASQIASFIFFIIWVPISSHDANLLLEDLKYQETVDTSPVWDVL